MNQAMTLYTYDAAPNPKRLNLFLAYKGVQLPTQQVDLRNLEQLSPAYRAINPRCVVPALRLEDGTVLCDVIAICWYLEQRFPQRSLLGTTPLQQAQVLSWDLQIFTEGLMSVADTLRNRSAAFKDRALPGPSPVEQIPQLEERGRYRLHQFWDRLEAQLQGRDFLVGETLSLADIDAWVVVDFAGWVKESIPEQHPRLRSWHQRVSAQLPGVGAQT